MGPPPAGGHFVLKGWGLIYTPKHFEVQQTALIHKIIRRYNFATLITVWEQTPIISHLPFLLDHRDGKNLLLAHMARANPQWRSFRQEVEASVLFQGPHAYVSPRWYQPKPDNVPTWNYGVVHAHGVPKIIYEEDAAFGVMRRLVQHHDPQWSFDLSDQDRRKMMREIVVFEIEVARFEAKFKLSQNRSVEDIDSIVRHLLQSGDQDERQTGELMGFLGEALEGKW